MGLGSVFCRVLVSSTSNNWLLGASDDLAPIWHRVKKNKILNAFLSVQFLSQPLGGAESRDTLKKFLASPSDWLLPDSASCHLVPVPPCNDHLMAPRRGREVLESLPLSWKGYY